MTALKDIWQQQRRDRQQQVQTMLLNFNQARQTQAAQQQLERQQFHHRLQQETTAELTAIARDRAILSQKLRLDLQRDRQQLSSAVVSLRQNLKNQLQSLQTETNSLLNSYQQQRQQMRQQQTKELAAFVIFLQAEVQDYFDQLAAQRPIRAAETQRMLKQDRIRRQNAIETLFQELAVFQSELQQHRQNLSQLVWGEATEAVQINELLNDSTAETTSNSPTPKENSPAIEPEAIELDSIEPEAIEPEAIQEAIEPKSVEPESVEPESIEPTVEPIELAIEPTEPLVIEPVAPIEDPWTEANQPFHALLQDEKRVYDYLAKQQGARLTEIETLGLTRFQIVDALRSLTQKGLVWQRDRLYLVKE